MAEDMELFEITEKCQDLGGRDLFPGEWTLWTRETEKIFVSREECEVYLAAMGYGIGGVRQRYWHSDERELVEVS